MKRKLKWGIPILVVVLLVIYGGAAFFIASGVTGDERGPLEDHPDNYSLVYQDVEFTSRDDRVPLKGWWIPGEEDASTIVFVHGITGDRSADNAVDLAARLADLGYNLLLFDQRAHGESDGDRVSGGYHERKDLGGALDFLLSEGIEMPEIGVLGMSMGSGTTLLTLADEPGITAAVVDSPYANVDDLIAFEVARKTFFPEWIVPIFIPGAKIVANLLYDINVSELNPEGAVAELDYPVLVVHGTADTRIPYEHGVRVHKAAHPDSVLWTVEDVDHVDAFLTFPEEYVRRVAEYFESRLGAQ